MAAKTESAQYTHGHHPAVLRAHNWRNVRNSAAYLLPHLQPHMTILDIGCGVGTITVDLARHVPQGHVVGIEPPSSSAVLEQARALAAESAVTNVTFVTGDANALAYADGSFDLVLCHQVLQHVRDPVGILREMHRVAHRIVAARESDYGAFTWFPATPQLRDWHALYARVARRNGGEPDAGRMLQAWAREAGLPRPRCSVSAWCFWERADVAAWGDTWAERTGAEDSALAKTAVGEGFATREQLEQIANGWREWAEDEDAWFSVPSGEIICFKE